MSKKDNTILVGQRYKVKELRIIKWNRNKAVNLMEEKQKEVMVDVRDNETILNVFKPVNEFCEYLLVAKLEKEEE